MHTISGRITEASSGESLVGASVYSQANQAGASTNQYGYFSLRIPTGKSAVRFSYVGYQTRERFAALQ